MSLHNINDPEGVKALLNTLRSSQAWADALESNLVAHPTTQPPAQSVRQPDSLHVPAPGPGDSGQTSIRPSSISGSPSHSTPSVAELLSQLCASQSPDLTSNATQGDRTLERPRLPPESANPSPVPKPDPPHTSQPHQDIRTLSFQHALPHISRIMEDPQVVENLSKMKEEQDKLEKQLWQEREDIRRKHEEKVKVAKNKTKMIGVGLSKQEAELMSDAFRTELRKFDSERVRSAWDGLVRGQQARLEALKVPTMFVTDDAGDVEKQRRVMHVLESVLSTSGPAQ